MSSPDVPAAVQDAIRRVLQESGREVPEMTDDATFAETLKLDSLDLAVMVVALETSLKVDPFRNGAAPVRTVGELVRLYEACVDKS